MLTTCQRPRNRG